MNLLRSVKGYELSKAMNCQVLRIVAGPKEALSMMQFYAWHVVLKVGLTGQKCETPEQIRGVNISYPGGAFYQLDRHG